MPDRPAHFNPEPPAEDYIPLAASALGMSILAGATIAAVVLLGVRGLVAQAVPTDSPNPLHGPGLLLLVGTLAACGTAVVSCWAALAPLPTYRRGGLSLVTGFAVVVAALLLTPVHALFGPPGLVGAAVVTGFGAWLLLRRVVRLRGGR